jgi:glycosyltransferase involved in cell wall biosynthesis
MREIAYVLKAYPRLSEPYITSEIHRVEQAGVKLRLFAIKQVEPWERASRYPVVERINAQPHFLPEMTSLSATPLRCWLRDNLPPYLPLVSRCARRRPLGTARAIAAAAAQTVRARRPDGTLPRTYLKELLQAAAVADGVLDLPAVGHLHAHYAHGATTVAWLASLITGLPFSFTGHARDIYDADRNPGGLLRRKLLAATFVVTCTGANRRHLLAIAPEATVHLVYHGLASDVQRALAGLAPRAPRNGHLRLLAVGRLVRKKGFDVFVEACGELARRGVAFEAAIVGPDGEHGEAVRRRIAELGLADRIELPGAMEQAALCDEYRRADALCQPCRLLDADRDGIPNVLVEAMACATPVVTTGVSGIPELVSDGVNGLLVEPDDHVALADAIERLRADRALAERLGRAGADTVRERFDGEQLAGRLVHLFRGAPA